MMAKLQNLVGRHNHNEADTTANAANEDISNTDYHNLGHTDGTPSTANTTTNLVDGSGDAPTAGNSAIGGGGDYSPVLDPKYNANLASGGNTNIDTSVNNASNAISGTGDYSPALGAGSVGSNSAGVYNEGVAAPVSSSYREEVVPTQQLPLPVTQGIVDTNTGAVFTDNNRAPVVTRLPAPVEVTPPGGVAIGTPVGINGGFNNMGGNFGAGSHLGGGSDIAAIALAEKEAIETTGRPIGARAPGAPGPLAPVKAAVVEGAALAVGTIKEGAYIASGAAHEGVQAVRGAAIAAKDTAVVAAGTAAATLAEVRAYEAQKQAEIDALNPPQPLTTGLGAMTINDNAIPEEAALAAGPSTLSTPSVMNQQSDYVEGPHVTPAVMDQRSEFVEGPHVTPAVMDQRSDFAEGPHVGSDLAAGAADAGLAASSIGSNATNPLETIKFDTSAPTYTMGGRHGDAYAIIPEAGNNPAVNSTPADAQNNNPNSQFGAGTQFNALKVPLEMQGNSQYAPVEGVLEGKNFGTAQGVQRVAVVVDTDHGDGLTADGPLTAHITNRDVLEGKHAAAADDATTTTKKGGLLSGLKACLPGQHPNTASFSATEHVDLHPAVVRQ